MGYTYHLLGSQAVFKKFAATYHILLHTTLFFLLMILFRAGKPEMIDFTNLEISKVSFRSVMGLLAAAITASAHLMCRNISAYYDATGSITRDYEEDAMFLGFLTLVFFLMNLFGFWGILCLSVSPPVVLVGLKVANLNI